MAHGVNIRTWFEGSWHDGNKLVLRAADHGTWLGSVVFDGARHFEGVAPDLDLHCRRLNHSAEAMGLAPTHGADEMVAIIREGISAYAKDAALYIRPMYWATEPGPGWIAGDPDHTVLCICLEEIPMPRADGTATLTTTRYCRPILASATVNAKAACLYPNNARMIREAMDKGFSNALVADQLGNVAETATSNIFMARDGEVFTPIPNHCFLNGITRQRHITLLRAAGVTVHETILRFDDFRHADEIFMTGNLSKITPVTAFDDVQYLVGPMANLARELYWSWAHSMKGALSG